MTSPSSENPGIAPADARPQRPWPLWAKLLAYTLFLALAIISVWFINRRVDALAQ
jgi:hypothetical protein